MSPTNNRRIAHPQEGPKEHQIDVWGMSSLQVGTGQTESDMAATAWKKITEIAGEIHNIIDLSKCASSP